MRAALAVIRVVPDRSANLSSVLDGISRAAGAGADLVVFGETIATGIANTDDPEHDLPLGERIPGFVTAEIGARAKTHGLHVALGLFERAGPKLYDSAVLLSPDGDIALHYRRIHPGWHGRDADASVYGHGTEIPTAETPLGTFAFLLCGDIFSDDLTDRVRELAPDWLLVPYARCFDDRSHNRERWEREELPEYRERIRRTGTTALLVNYLGLEEMGDAIAFGGATVVAGDGSVVASHPLGEECMIVVDLPAGDRG